MQNYIKDITITSFKGIQNLKLENMKAINILVGDNNCKKTTVLEAIELFEKPFDFISHLKRAGRIYNKDNIRYNKIKEMFYNCDLDNDIRIHMDIDGKVNKLCINGEKQKIEDVNNTVLTYNFNEESIEFVMNENQNNPSIPKKEFELLNISYVMPIDIYIEENYIESIEYIIQNGKKQKLIKILNFFDPNIIDIEINRDREIYVTTADSKCMSMSIYGDGFKKSIILVSRLIEAENGILLIDEIETAIHKDIVGKLFRYILNNSKEHNTQLILTTHSLEAMSSIINNFMGKLDQVVVYRLEEFKEQIYSRRFSGEKVYEILIDEGGDLR